MGRAVVAARLAHGMTQSQLAAALGLTQRYVSELETGKSRTLSPKLFDLLDQLGIQLSFRIATDD
nr:helix-turn-helix transcriptional regulator [Paeniglutamicibacter psychrophenolicus]